MPLRGQLSIKQAHSTQKAKNNDGFETQNTARFVSTTVPLKLITILCNLLISLQNAGT